VKKFALSLIAIAASGAFVWAERGSQEAADDLLSLPPAKANGGVPVVHDAPTTEALPADVVPPRGEDEAALSMQPRSLGVPVAVRVRPFEPRVPVATAAALTVPLPHIRPSSAGGRPKVVPVATTNAGGFADGTFTGPVADAYYGQVQVQAVVQNGQIVSIKVLQYPSDRRTSVAINRQALPMLRDEVISAQSPNVDIISGATLTSEAFIQSLSAALRGARA
jgi:uncharacterized protein with FMN-binding domain